MKSEITIVRHEKEWTTKGGVKVSRVESLERSKDLTIPFDSLSVEEWYGTGIMSLYSTKGLYETSTQT